MRKRKFKFNGEIFTTMADIAREVGVTRIQPRDFKKYGIEEISDDAMAIQPDVDSEISVVDTAKIDEMVAAAKEGKVENIVLSGEKAAISWNLYYSDLGWVSDGGDDPIVLAEAAIKGLIEAHFETAYSNYQKQLQQPVKRDRRFTRKLGTEADIREVKAVVSVCSVDEFSNKIKHFTMDALVSMAVDAGINTWDSIDNEPIRKMRVIMGLKDYYFPGQKTQTKKVVSWVKVDIDIMVKLAEDNGLEFKRSDNVKIQRMWVTAALNAAGYKPEDYEGKGIDDL